MSDPTRLTTFSHGAGCGCKIGPGMLADILARVAPATHPNLLVGTDTGDDAGVWRLDDDRALIATTDFFTPIVDDARTWGRIAATNAASDVYAMGGAPLFALNLVAWPTEVLSTELLGEVLAGGADAARAGGWVTLGGHSIDDPEPKYGQAVIGEVHPDRVLTNAGMRDGDALILTKPLGTGAITTAVKHQRDAAGALDAAIESMTTLNDIAARAAAGRASAATDVTGFGLLGHLKKMVLASRVTAHIDAAAVPAIAGTREALAAGMVSGGTRRNREWVDDIVDAAVGVAEEDLVLLADAQTSGGLLLSVPERHVEAVMSDLAGQTLTAAVIGHVTGLLAGDRQGDGQSAARISVTRGAGGA